MPRVPRSSPLRLVASIDAVRAAAIERLGAQTNDEEHLQIAAGDGLSSNLTLRLRSDGRFTAVETTSDGEPHIPFYHVQKLDKLITRMIESELAGRRIEPEPGDIVRTVGRPIN